jgi:hypothetical protein
VIVSQSYKINAAAKENHRLQTAFIRFRRSLKRIETRQVNESWFMASVRGLVAFGITSDIARAKCEAALRNQLLSGLRVVEGGKSA